MRTVLLASTSLLAITACTPVMRAARLQMSSSLPPVEVYHADAKLGSRPTLLIAREVLDGWNFLYQHITDTEFALCLEGRREGDRVEITGFRLAHILVSNFNAIKYAPCVRDGTYIGTAHNHPPADYPNEDPCYQSPVDQRTFRNDSEAKVDIIICGRDRFVWVLKDDKGPRVWQTTARQ
ncbi:MAG TPA: hypothetical protein VGC44_05625 [Longimicrobiales bacterium]